MRLAKVFFSYPMSALKLLKESKLLNEMLRVLRSGADTKAFSRLSQYVKNLRDEELVANVEMMYERALINMKHRRLELMDLVDDLWKERDMVV